MDTAQRNSSHFPVQAPGNGGCNGGFTHAGRANQTNDLSGDIRRQLANRQQLSTRFSPHPGHSDPRPKSGGPPRCLRCPWSPHSREAPAPRDRARTARSISRFRRRPAPEENTKKSRSLNSRGTPSGPAQTPAHRRGRTRRRGRRRPSSGMPSASTSAPIAGTTRLEQSLHLRLPVRRAADVCSITCHPKETSCSRTPWPPS